MRTGRSLVLAFLVTTSCAGILGIEDDQKSAIQTLCKCDNVKPYYGDPPICVPTLERALEVATEPTRAHWMQNFSEKCAQSPCASALECLSLVPTCISTGENCGVESTDGLACCKKTCVSGVCG